VEAPFEVDATRVGGGEDGGRPGEVLEAFLVCARCRAVRPVFGGVGVLVADLDAHLDAHGNVYRRAPIADPRVTRFVLGRAGSGGDVVPFAEVVDRYGDLLPAAPDAPARAPSAYDADLARWIATCPRATVPALEIGCGVGRGTFVLAAHTGDATGIDRSVARVRRARNVATTAEFHLPIRPGARVETPIDLSRLARDDVDFVVAGPDPLPFAAATFHVVVLRHGDGDGPFADVKAALAEARRVIDPRGLLLIENGPGGPLGAVPPVEANRRGDSGA
jgi:hypothetical protein